MERYLCIGGTKESRIICDFLIEKNIEFFISVATEYGKESFQSYERHLISGRMDLEKMEDFIREKNITSILDFSHPFAKEVSKNAIEVSRKLNLTYIRYEREASKIDSQNIIYVKDHEEACKKALSIGKNTFLTVGSNNIDKYVDKGFEHLYVRVLPRSSILKKLEQSNIISSDIIAMQGPFTKEMNILMLKKYKSDTMISKESGDIGGFNEKLQACEYMNIPLIVIKKPPLEYPNKYTEIFEIERIILKNNFD